MTNTERSPETINQEIESETTALEENMARTLAFLNQEPSEQEKVMERIAQNNDVYERVKNVVNLAAGGNLAAGILHGFIGADLLQDGFQKAGNAQNSAAAISFAFAATMFIGGHLYNKRMKQTTGYIEAE